LGLCGNEYVEENNAHLIRRASLTDIPRILEMGRHFAENSPYAKVLKVSDVAMEALAHKLIPQGWILLSEHDGEAVGMIGFYVYPHFLSGEIVAGEIFWWMEPEHRGAGKALLKAAEDEARRCGAKSMQMIAPEPRVGKLYERYGYQYVESSYQRNLELR
jgi:GNAT superfamily N-acetyltransferase